jgi:ATP-dependent Clp protease ATP-binding subunit ClpA
MFKDSSEIGMKPGLAQTLSDYHPFRAKLPTRLPFTTLERVVIPELHRVFRPELIGRFDEKIVFKPLSHDIQREIGCLAISQELERFKERGRNLTVSEAAF